ncbi:MAG: Gfo/Idh/MocA family protein, partial [Flavitalea sp.]
MNTNRRKFLKLSGLTGMMMAGGEIPNPIGAEPKNKTGAFEKSGSSLFNMCGYSAPKLETVRIGFIGLGNRGPSAVMRTSKIEGVDIKALCDIRPEKANSAKKKLAEATKAFNPQVYSGSENEWKKVCDRNDIDLIYIATPWNLHAPMAIYAMKQGKHVATEVPAAVTVEECWQLVETSEKTRKHCMILENCCYDFFELLTLNMARQGFFGEIVHCEGAYIHDLLKSNFSKENYYNMWRLKENFRNGNLYPTHGLGPVAQVLNINRGDKMDYLVSVSTNDFMMESMAKELADKDQFFKDFANKNYRGNMNTTTIRTNKG